MPKSNLHFASKCWIIQVQSDFDPNHISIGLHQLKRRKLVNKKKRKKKRIQFFSNNCQNRISNGISTKMFKESEFTKFCSKMIITKKKKKKLILVFTNSNLFAFNLSIRSSVVLVNSSINQALNCSLVLHLPSQMNVPARV